MTRIHVHNAANEPSFAVTAAMFDGTGHTVSVGTTAEELRAGLLEAEALIAAATGLHTHFPCPAPHLKMIFCTSAGLERLAPYDWIPEGVALLNNSGTHSGRAGEYVAMAMLMLAAQMPALIKAQHEERWEKRYGSVLAGRSVAVVGTGGLGAAAGRQARHFGMNTTGVRTQAVPHPDFDRIVAAADIDTILPETEFLVLAAPLTPSSRGLISRQRLELLPKGAKIINVGRGALVDQDALCDLLDSGHLAGAVLDVFVPEPIPPGHRLWTTPNLVITPHVSADDPATYAKDSVAIFLENLAAHTAGKPMPNLFDTVRGY
jgi:phosphoglycerate dehydrogenase-like enzyme